MIKLIKNFIAILIIEFIYIFIPLYVVLIYKKQHKIRSKIYNYWLLNNKDRFINLKGFNLSNDFFKFYYVDDKYTIIHYNNKLYYIGYSADFNNFNKTNILLKFYYKISYLLYYYFGYIFLDDVNNINGINNKVFNSRLFNTINNYELKLLEGIKVQKSVFELEYWEDKYVPTMEQCKFFINKSYTYNYLRDKGYNNKFKKFLLLSYKFDVETKSYLFAINNKILLKRVY